MVEYDPNIIREHARRLYEQAQRLMFVYGFGLGLLGLLGGWMIGSGDLEKVSAVIGAVLLGLLGVAIGRERGFELRLRAQIALCQVQIELNGRAPAARTQAS